MTQKRELGTAFGDVEYETVTCSSCGEEVVKSEAKRFAIGGYTGIHFGEHTFSDSETALGWACPYCADDPVGFPANRYQLLLGNDGDVIFYAIIAFILGMVVMALIVEVAAA